MVSESPHPSREAPCHDLLSHLSVEYLPPMMDLTKTGKSVKPEMHRIRSLVDNVLPCYRDKPLRLYFVIGFLISNQASGERKMDCCIVL